MKFIIFSVLLIIGALLFFAGDETGKDVAKSGGIHDSTDAGCLGCIGVIGLIIFGFIFLLKILF